MALVGVTGSLESSNVPIYFPLGPAKMPYRSASYNHDWPLSGSLSILKYEYQCGFCTSTEDYKPASALRKVHTHRIPRHEGRVAGMSLHHVLTHQKLPNAIDLGEEHRREA